MFSSFPVQTMGTPAHSLPFRSDNKLYRLQSPQSPLVQTATHGEFKMDEFPNGTNAVVGKLAPTTIYPSQTWKQNKLIQYVLLICFLSRSKLHRL